jgi:aspartate/methionine/tyrosine aminotransferase
MGAIADGSDTDYLRLENLDTDVPPDAAAIDRTRQLVADDSANSYLPFVGQDRLRKVAARHVSKLTGCSYGMDNVVISAGGLSGILNALLATIDVGDEVIVTDSTYAGLLNRIRLAGGVPVYAPLRFTPGDFWTLPVEGIRAAITSRTRALLLMSPSMPTGTVFTDAEWQSIAQLCIQHDLLLILDSAMERLLFDGGALVHPASLEGMQQRTIIVGAASKELRMIGWRVGWTVAPLDFMPDLVAVSLANVVVPVGIAQDAVATAIESSYQTLPDYVGELQRRRDTVALALKGLPFGMPAGGWSMLLRVSDFGLDGIEMSKRLLNHGVCATAMDGWGVTHGKDYIRFVYANEPVARLKLLGDRVRAALESK